METSRLNIFVANIFFKEKLCDLKPEPFMSGKNRT